MVAGTSCLRGALVCLALLAGFQAAEAQNCVALGQQLQNGACQSMQAQLVSNANQVLNAPCNALAQRVQQQQPSAECCADTRAFVEAGCACDQNLLALAPLAGVSPNAIRAGGRVAQVSLCASDRMGGPINDPCPGTNCAAYRPR